jgi:ribosomal-protein-alanine acetyltransferase
MRIRRATPSDIPAMVQLERENLISINWSHQHYANLLEPAASELSENFFIVLEDAAESKGESLVALRLPIAGYLAAQGVDGEWDLQYIIVAKEWQRRGFATMLLNGLMAHVRSKNGRRICLEVRASNQSALALYRKHGFEEVGVRKGYYANPPDDAILCRLSLS